MSTAKTRKPRPSRLLDGFPPDTRIVAAGVTWDDYENLVNQVGNARNCRIAFDGKDIEMISPPKIDRPGIYAALQVPEFWRYATRQCPSNSSVRMGRMPRCLAAVSYECKLRMSPGGSSARFQAAW